MIKREDIVAQEELVNLIDKMIEENTVPHFILFTGRQGSGRKFFTKYLAEQMSCNIFKSDTLKNTMEYTREVIEQATTQQTPTIYLFPDIDYCREPVANALLKITEEPPQNAYFVLTCQKGNVIPKTLRSRCFEYRIKPYNYEQLQDVAIRMGCKPNNLSSILMRCTSPGMIQNQLQAMTTNDNINEFVEKVLDNIGTVSDANVFKIAEKLSFKDEEPGYNLNTFFTSFNAACMQRTKAIATPNRAMYFRFVKTTNSYRDSLIIRGINKRNIFDTWLLAIRDIYDKYNR